MIRDWPNLTKINPWIFGSSSCSKFLKPYQNPIPGTGGGKRGPHTSEAWDPLSVCASMTAWTVHTSWPTWAARLPLAFWSYACNHTAGSRVHPGWRLFGSDERKLLPQSQQKFKAPTILCLSMFKSSCFLQTFSFIHHCICFPSC